MLYQFISFPDGTEINYSEIITKKLIKTISDYHEEIEDKWKDFFKVNDVTYIDKVKANDVNR